LFAVYLATEPGKGREALRSVLQELSLLREVSLPEEELEHAKVQLKGRLMLGLESMSARMVRLAQQEILLGIPVSLDETKARIDAVTAQDVQLIARELFRRRQLSLVAIGPVRQDFFQLRHLQE
jgi:predicted Zn-dependent peptidase